MTTIITSFSPAQRLSLLVVSTAVLIASAAAVVVTLANVIVAA